MSSTLIKAQYRAVTLSDHTRFVDHIRNEEILEEMKVEPVGQKLRRYKSNLL
jgi:hypothetical protein